MPILRPEINFANQATPYVSSNTGNELIQIDTTQYSGSIACYLELAVINSAPGNITFSLTRVSGGTVDAAIISTNNATATLLRSASFTPPAGVTEYKVNTSGSSASLVVKGLRVVIIQDTASDPLTSTETQIEIGSLSTVTATAIPTGATNMTNPKYWKYTAANWDSIAVVYFEATFKGSSSKTACSVALQHDDGSFGATWTTLTTITTTSTSATRVRSAAITLVAGRNYRIVGAAAESKTGMTVYNAKIVIQQNTTPITLLEPQYLLANTVFATGTSLQNFLTKWDSAEWSGVTNTYYHAVDSNAASSVVELDTAAGTQLTNSPVTTPSGSKQTISSSGVTMPADGNLDTKATTNNGSIFANRILVAVVIGAAVTSAIKTINGLAYASVKTFNSVAVANIKTILGLA